MGEWDGADGLDDRHFSPERQRVGALQTPLAALRPRFIVCAMSVVAPVTSPEPGAVIEPLGPLAARLAAADRSLQKERGAVLLLRAWPWVVGYVFAAFALDVVLHLGGGLRLGLTAGFALLVLAGIAWCAWIAFGKRNPFEHTARILESRHPRLGSKLINLLQLRAQTHDPALVPLTRELAALAITSYARELRDEPIEQLARTDAPSREAKRTGLALLGVAALLALGFDITRTEGPRFLDPFGDHPPYSFTRLEISDPATDGAQVIYNEGVLITAKAAGHHPGELFLSCFPPGQPEQETTVPMFNTGPRGFTQQIENVRTDLVVFAHTKNRHALSRQRRIAVILTPRLETAWVKITPPAYTGLAPDERPFNFKGIKALAGSTIEFRLASNRPLASGQLTMTTAAGAVEPLPLTPRGEKEVAGAFEAKQPAQLKFTLLDRDGFASAETWECALTVTHDLPPEVQVSNPNADTFVAMDFKAAPVIEASDDYGVKTLRIHVGRNGEFGEPRVFTPERSATHAREALAFDFNAMGLASGDTISIFAEAIDTAPDPHLSRSRTVTLTVITTEDYNAFLRERTDLSDIEAKYSKLVNELHDLIEQQQKLGEEIAALKEQLANAKTDAEKAAAQKKLDDLLAQQRALDARLNQLASTMENFVRDQPLYDIEAELKETLAEKAQELRDSAKANEEALKNVAAQKSGQQPPSQKMLDDFKQASDEQLARLGATEQAAQEEVVKPLEDLSLLHEIIKDINRFKDLYAAQQELAKQSKAYDRATPLSREDQLALKDLAAQEKMIGDELDAVEQKLWEDGKAAQEKFPKAAGSAQGIAQAMGDLKLQTLANQTTREMLAGHGDKGAQLAENLRGEMEKLFSKCNSQGGGMSNELDQYLSIQRSMTPGMNFQQMMQCRKFGSGFKPGSGSQGNGGSDGYAVMTGPNPNVLGNEARISESDKAQINGQGRNKAAPNGAQPEVALDTPDVVEGVNAVNRESEAVQSETTIEQYSDLVEKYFKALTKDPKKAKP